MILRMIFCASCPHRGYTEDGEERGQVNSSSKGGARIESLRRGARREVIGSYSIVPTDSTEGERRSAHPSSMNQLGEYKGNCERFTIDALLKQGSIDEEDAEPA